MPYSSRVSKYLMVISTWLAFVPEEMNLFVFLLYELQAETFVPTFGEYIKANLPTNWKGQQIVCKLLSESFYECLSDSCPFVKLFKLFSLLSRAITADRTHINHTCPIFYESPSLDGDVKVSYVVETEVDQFLQAVLT